jgi:hypothetical protein
MPVRGVREVPFLRHSLVILVRQLPAVGSSAKRPEGLRRGPHVARMGRGRPQAGDLWVN